MSSVAIAFNEVGPQNTRVLHNSAILPRVTKPSPDVGYWIDKLKLEPHPEGGYYRQTYKSELLIAHDCLPSHPGSRAASTAIYFLIEGKNFSAFHRLRSDEMWHFYAGSPLLLHVIDRVGAYSSFLLGNDLDAGQRFQAVVPAGHWFASHVADWTSWTLVGCSVAPGFDFADFELARREQMVLQYPNYSELIHSLTRK